MSATKPLTLEQMRADVADVLDEPAADIGDDDNLNDLGLDSMRVLGLVMQWGRSGIALDLSHLAGHLTLAGWWQTVQDLQRQAGQK